jgi:hypothetical protein
MDHDFFHLAKSTFFKSLHFSRKGTIAFFELKFKFLCENKLPIELSIKSSKESTETISLLKIGNQVVEVG